MKNIFLFSIITALFLSVTSCEMDNYNAPGSTIHGAIIDQNGTPLQTEQGGSNMRIKMEELSWALEDSTVAIIPTYLNVKQDGTYINSKVFSGEYRMTPVEGPFFPYEEEGEILNISGVTTEDFSVIPYLTIEWVTKPYLNDSAYIRGAVRFVRNSKEGEIKPDLLNAQLFISTTKYCGNNNYDNQLVASPIPISNAQEGQTISLVSSRAIKYVGTTYYVRIGICCNDAYKKYNYTDIQPIEVGDDVVIPILPKQIPNANLSCIKLESDVSLEGGNGANSMFDGSLTEKYEPSRSEVWPQSFTIDLGKEYDLVYFRMFPFDREDFYFKRHTVATFELYGWNGEGEPEDDWNSANWVKIDDYINEKPSGMPTNSVEYNRLTDEDREVSQNGTLFEVPEGTEEYRYVRFLVTDNFNRTTEYGGTGSDGNRFNISELKFWYLPEE